MSDILQLRAATIDLARREVRRGEDTLPLSELEASLLAWLAAHPGEPADRDRLLVEVWGFPKAVATRAVDNTVARLRSKIEVDPKEPSHLRTVRGRGYVLVLDEAPVSPRSSWQTPSARPRRGTCSATRTSIGLAPRR